MLKGLYLPSGHMLEDECVKEQFPEQYTLAHSSPCYKYSNDKILAS